MVWHFFKILQQSVIDQLQQIYFHLVKEFLTAKLHVLLLLLLLLMMMLLLFTMFFCLSLTIIG